MFEVILDKKGGDFGFNVIVSLVVVVYVQIILQIKILGGFKELYEIRKKLCNIFKMCFMI